MRSAPMQRLFGTVFISSLLISCGPPAEEEVDKDGDGFTISQGDCNDFDPATNPGAIDICDGQDNNCNFKTDENDDQDQDGASTCNGGDCDDLNPAVGPGFDEVFDNLDNDCNCPRDASGDTNGDGLICGPGDAGVDDDPRAIDLDGDGFCEGINGECQDGSQPGDCRDDDPLISPGSIEVEGDSTDNNCDGQVDEAPVPCDSGLNPGDPFSFAKAIGLGCAGEVQNAQFVGPMFDGANDPPNAAASRAIVAAGAYGNNLQFPFEGSSYVILSSGTATSEADHSFSDTDFSGDFFNSFDTTTVHPDPKIPAPGDTCAESDFTNAANTIPVDVNDYVEYRVAIKVPPNANGFSYRLQFLSAEYPDFHCTEFDDTFLAILASQNFTGNISFDANGRVLSINSGFFQICDTNDQGNICLESTNSGIAGTGFTGHGGTKPLVTTVPSVIPGEILELRFIIFDEGDHALDSSILLDDWRWIGVPCEDDPATPNFNECDPVTKIP